jgi:hypothetical protein
LYTLADAILGDNAFPKGRPLERFLGSNYSIGSEEYTILLDLGFGEPLARKVKLVTIQPRMGLRGQPLIHKHVVYPWPPVQNDTVKCSRDELVFPAILSDTSDLESAIDNHLTRLLDDSKNFAWFPLWRSELQVLKGIYVYYRQLRDVSGSTTSHPELC